YSDIRSRLVPPAAWAAGDSPDVVSVPDLSGCSIRLARCQAARLGLELVFEGTGRVDSQSPRAGARVEPGSKVMVSCRP
ncbi:MAG: PASTA domain-containing protein, partial [Candidatus Eisenbacteria bacterium]|nr:PASTA domain-containing protein [Candidatus Eisenbacteria bacterium]